MLRSLTAGMMGIALVVAGCGDDDGGKSSENLTASTEGGATTSTLPAGGAGECKLEGAANTTATEELVVHMNEWTIKPSAQPKAGFVSIKAENTGKENHELVIVKGDTAAEALPKDADGGMDEDKLPEGGLIGEIEPFAPASVCKGVFNLPAGKYVLLCNITETEPNGEKESHFKEGMHVPLVVS